MISVCIATYNGAAYLKQQVASILSQLSPEDEIVVSDDHSTDDTCSILDSFADPRIKVFQNMNHGVTWNFENALRHASGDYIFLSDQDDEWMPDKVKVFMTYLGKYDCVVSDCYISDGNDNIIGESFFSLNRTRPGRWYNLILKSGYIGCCMAFKKEILAKVLPFPTDIPLHDMWIGNISAFKYHVGWIPDKLIKYRRHGMNASSAAEKSRSSLSQKLGYRWHVIKHLFF